MILPRLQDSGVYFDFWHVQVGGSLSIRSSLTNAYKEVSVLGGSSKVENDQDWFHILKEKGKYRILTYRDIDEKSCSPWLSSGDDNVKIKTLT